ncbi:TIGR00282 family metallophosphoesterase [Geobacillus sp. G4]|mgnify:FL=1|uniref:Metallophosphoesterase n=7 Tax=Geobacillus TaxID=129337 RepID=A0A7U9JA12_GEOTM|nr:MULTISPECIES: TIGR00282 family metallophosphoesterase [Geobacillus]ALA69085.1 metallophosphoesterase [Geobacillus stearothermophilus 10]ADI27224.1 metallophosphoesterase [Geobacillus sp. C56-T3]ADU93676.1 metallophosphoesterase [Geobacillus sp. Y412MC52]AEV18807.1 hypothetical protein GTCCBUS3UF5_14940 [Geobacillus thermoleovorans CCB_US3_UF5]AGE21761.1 putative phosphatase [Geobacillus sp. GHH01]
MRILFIGDVVGLPGQKMVEHYLPRLKEKHRPDVVVINGENAAGGKGITEPIYRALLAWGAHVITLGNHAWDKRDIFEFIDQAKALIRPANYPPGTPGKGIVFVPTEHGEAAVINLQGRAFLPAIDCPFQKADELIAAASARTPVIIVDFHAEATSEKQAMGWYLDGRVSAVIGTHTHVQTADNRILPRGTAYITDVGMTGPYDGILGVDREAVLRKFLTGLPVRFDVKEGRSQLNAVFVDVDEKSGRAFRIERLIINDDHPYFE